MNDRVIRIKIDASGAKREIGQIDGQMRNLGGTADRLQTQLTRVASAIATAFSVRQIVAYADAYTSIQNRLRVVTNGTEQLTRVTSELLQVANATRAEYETTATLFSTLTRSTEDLAISEERLIAITSTINKSFAVQGANAQSAANAIRQLAQGLDAGALRGDEFNSVAEQAPAILRAVQEELGVSRGELRDLAAEGKITAELLIRSIEGYAETVDREYAKTNRTFEQSAVVAKNNAIAFVGASEALNDATKAAGDSLVVLSENLDVLSDVFLLISAVVAGKYITSIGAAIKADIAKRASTISLIRSEQALAVEQSRRAIQDQQAAQRALANAANDKSRAVAITNLARANQAAIAAQVRLNAATAAYAGAASAAGIAARGASAAFALLGGPLGVVLLAASALLIFTNNSEDAGAASAGLDSEISSLAESYKKLSQQAFSSTALSLQREAIKIDQELADKKSELAAATKDAISELDVLGGQVRSVGTGTRSLKNEIAALEAAKSALAPKIAAVNKFFEDGLPAIDDYKELSKESAKDTSELALKLADLSAKVSQSSVDYAVFAERQKLVKDGFSTEAIEKYLVYFRSLKELEGKEQNDETAARINQRIEGLRLETQTIASETMLQQAVRQGALSQEQADLDLQTATKIQKAITERELLLAEKSITDEQIAATELAFQEQLTSISEQHAEQRLQVRRAEFSQQISMYSNYANAALALGDAFGSKSEKANKRRRRVGVIVDTAAGIGRAFAENNFYTALGISALIAANGAAQLSAINSAGGSGGGSISGASGGSVALPTQPTAAASVQTLEIVGLREEIERLEAADGFVSTQFVAKVLEKIDSANRLMGGG